MSCTPGHLNERRVQMVAVNSSYLSPLSEVDQNGILITLMQDETEVERIIPLELKCCDNHGVFLLSYKDLDFDYFPADSIIKVSKLLLKKLGAEDNEFDLNQIRGDLSYGDWNVIQIEIDNASDCDYLFTKAIENEYKTILAMQLEVIDVNNLSQKFTFYLNGITGPLVHRGITEKDTKMVKAFRDYEFNVNIRNGPGWTPLHIAADSETPDIMDILINNGADVNALNDKRQSPLHLAAMRKNLEILEILLTNQAELDIEDKFHKTPLFYAVATKNVEVVDFLLKKGANYTITDQLHRTPFHMAAEQHNLHVIKVFLQNNVQVDLLNEYDQTPLFFICETPDERQPKTNCHEESRKIVHALLHKGANINLQDSDGSTPLHHAIINDNVEVMKILLDYNADISIRTNLYQNILHIACWNQADKSIEALLDCDIDINDVDAEKKTALHAAVSTNNYYGVELLLKKNPDVNMRDENGKTALHLAIESESLQIINLLLENRADVNLKDGSGKTALHLASEKSKISSGTIQSLFHYTNDIDAKDNLGRTALHYAALNDSFWTLKFLLEHNANVNEVDNDLITPLHLAFLSKNGNIIRYLLSNEADVKMKDINNRTIFHYAFMSRMKKRSRTNNDDEEFLLTLLYDTNISVNCIDKFGKTPLHYVAESSNLLMNKALLMFGADINILDNENKSSFDYFLKRWNHAGFLSKSIFQEHIIKMKVLKWWVHKRILDKVYNADSIENQSWIKFFEDTCTMEVDMMKSIKIDQSSISFYDFLKKHSQDAIHFVRNENVVKAIKSRELMCYFPTYDDFFKRHLRIILRRSNLCEQIQKLLQSHVFGQLPMLCMHEIFRYLENPDLDSFLEALKSR